jgi:hypothetical protein
MRAIHKKQITLNNAEAERLSRGVLGGVFSLAHNDSLYSDPKTSVFLPAPIYDSCWQLHELSYLLALSLEHVFNNREHALIISEGYDLGYRMPNPKQWKGELTAFKDFLHEFKPFQTRPEGKEFVSVSIQQAHYLNSLAHYADFMVARIFKDMFESDYLKPFQNYKKAGYTYKGANVGQQVSECYTGLRRLQREIESFKQLGNSLDRLISSSTPNKNMISNHNFCAE